MKNLENKIGNEPGKGRITLPLIAIQLGYVATATKLDIYYMDKNPDTFGPLFPMIIGLEVAGLFGIPYAYNKIYNSFFKNK